MLYYTVSADSARSELGTPPDGLTDAEASQRANQYGPNQIKLKGEPLWKKLIEPFANVFVGVLVVAAAISLSHHDYLEASIIAVIITVSAVIYYVQRFSTERVLRALRASEREQAEVIRDGRTRLIDSSQLVPGDIILLSEGQKIPADARVLSTDSLRVDESQLTGESLPIEKHVDALDKELEVYEQTNMVFSGSFVIGGSGQALVVGTGNETEFGKLAKLSSDTNLASPIQEKIDHLLQRIIVIIAVIMVAAFGLALHNGMEPSEATRYVIALAVSVIPEGLPIATSVVLVLGMRRMAAKKALVRTMRAIETLGTLTTIATDKTGTLTKNKLTVQDTWQLAKKTAVPFDELISGSLNYGNKRVHDPLDIALHNYILSEQISERAAPPLHSYAFDQAVAMSGCLYHHGDTYRLYLKGAPEKLIEATGLSAADAKRVQTKLDAYAKQGYRVIALAWADTDQTIESLQQLPKKLKLHFAGLLTVADVLRPEAPQAIATALSAGITVRMITGDHLETAYHIGRELGMCSSKEQVFDCRKMRSMSDEELESVVDHIRVFSRVVPEQKHRLLTILKKRHITAMTGDGVNDVPALRNAHVGVAMGSGASIAREAGDIVLVDDNFKSIVDAVEQGRIIFSNIKRMVAFLMATSTGEVVVNLGALILGMPIPLIPIQILWVNLMTETPLVIPLGLEPGERGVMKQKPSPPKAPLFTRLMITRIILIASTVGGVTLGMYWLFSSHYGLEYGRTMAFATLVTLQWGNALVLRSDHAPIWRILRRRSAPFWTGIAISFALQMIVLTTPLGALLRIESLPLEHLLLALVVGVGVPLLVVEPHKAWQRRRTRR